MWQQRQQAAAAAAGGGASGGDPWLGGFGAALPCMQQPTAVPLTLASPLAPLPPLLPAMWVRTPKPAA